MVCIPCQQAKGWAPDNKRLAVSFRHGLGDCANLALFAKMLTARGYVLDLAVDSDKEFIFSASGARVNAPVNGAVARESYSEASSIDPNRPTDYWRYNKIGKLATGGNAPWPKLGEPSQIWEELCETDCDLSSLIPLEAQMKAANILLSLPRPIILFHGKGNTSQASKNLKEDQFRPIYRAIQDAVGGTLLLLDWDDRIPRIASHTVRHVADEWGHLSIPELAALIVKSNCVVSIDSGPAHFARLFATPVVGLWHEEPCHPAVYALPSPKHVNIVRSAVFPAGTKASMSDYNIVLDPAASGVTPSRVAQVIKRVISPSEYVLPRGTDAWLQWLVDQANTSGDDTDELSGYRDRNKGFSYLLRRFKGQQPKILETGRAFEWEGHDTRFASYLLGAYASTSGGSLVSVDCDRERVIKAKSFLSTMRNVSVVQSDAIEYINASDSKFDIAFIGGIELDRDDHQDYTLREVQAASGKMADGGVIAIDDAPYGGKGAWLGKGALAIPWLLENGWVIATSGYVTVLERE